VLRYGIMNHEQFNITDEQIASLIGASFILRDKETKVIEDHMILLNPFKRKNVFLKYEIICNKTIILLQKSIIKNEIVFYDKTWDFRFFKPMIEQPNIWHKDIFYDRGKLVDGRLESCLIM